MQTILDGIIVLAGEDLWAVYTTTDPNNYGDNEAAMNTMEIVGYETKQSGYIKEFDLGEAAHIIPKSVGGNTTKYKCDYTHTQENGRALLVIFFGGDSGSGMTAGLCAFNSGDDVGNCLENIGFRLVSTSVSFPESK